MKTTWYVKYEIINKPGIKTFDTLEEATLFARKIMKKHSEIPKYLSSVRKGNRKAFRGAVADFLKKYYSNPEFTFNPEDVPSDCAEDYSEKIPDGIIFGENLDDDDEADYEYYSPDDYFEEDEFESPLSARGIYSDGYGDTGLPSVECNISFLPNEDGIYKCSEEQLTIRVYKIKTSGGRSNPLLVLKQLTEGRRLSPGGNAAKRKNTYDPWRIEEYFDINYEDEFDFMCNRTIFRHIELLRSLGYVIEHERFINEEDGETIFDRKRRSVEHYFTFLGKTAPDENASFGKSAYPIIVLRILEEAEKPLLQNEIIERAQKMFNGTTLHRKAIGNSIKELLDQGYKVEHTRDGYFLHQTQST